MLNQNWILKVQELLSFYEHKNRSPLKSSAPEEHDFTNTGQRRVNRIIQSQNWLISLVYEDKQNKQRVNLAKLDSQLGS